MIDFKIVLFLLILTLIIIVLCNNKTEHFDKTDSSYITNMYTKLKSEKCSGDTFVPLPEAYKPFTTLCYNKKDTNPQFPGIVQELSKNSSGNEQLKKKSKYLGCYSITGDTQNYFDNSLNRYDGTKEESVDSTYVLKTYQDCLNKNENKSKPIGLLRKYVTQNSLSELFNKPDKGYCIHNNNKNIPGSKIEINYDATKRTVSLIKEIEGGSPAITPLKPINDFYCDSGNQTYTGGRNAMAVYHSEEKEDDTFFYDNRTLERTLNISDLVDYNKNVIAYYGAEEDFLAEVKYNNGNYEILVDNYPINIGVKSVYQENINLSDVDYPKIKRFILKDYSNEQEHLVLNYNWLHFEGNYIVSDTKMTHYLENMTYINPKTSSKQHINPKKTTINYGIDMCKISGNKYFGAYNYDHLSDKNETNIVIIDEIDYNADLVPDCITMRGLADKINVSGKYTSILELENVSISSDEKKSYWPYVGQRNPCVIYHDTEKGKKILKDTIARPNMNQIAITSSDDFEEDGSIEVIRTNKKGNPLKYNEITYNSQSKSKSNEKKKKNSGEQSRKLDKTVRQSRNCNLLAITRVMKPEVLHNFEGAKTNRVVLEEKNNLFLNSSHNLLKKIYNKEGKGVVLNLKYKCKKTPNKKKEKRGGIMGDPIISVSSNRTLKFYSEQKKYCQEAFHWSFVHNYIQPKYYTYPEKHVSTEYDGLLHIDERKVVAVVFFLPENYNYLQMDTIKFYDLEGNIISGKKGEVYEVVIKNKKYNDYSYINEIVKFFPDIARGIVGGKIRDIGFKNEYENKKFNPYKKLKELIQAHVSSESHIKPALKVVDACRYLDTGVLYPEKTVDANKNTNSYKKLKEIVQELNDEYVKKMLLEIIEDNKSEYVNKQFNVYDELIELINEHITIAFNLNQTDPLSTQRNNALEKVSELKKQDVLYQEESEIKPNQKKYNHEGDNRFYMENQEFKQRYDLGECYKDVKDYLMIRFTNPTLISRMVVLGAKDADKGNILLGDSHLKIFYEGTNFPYKDDMTYEDITRDELSENYTAAISKYPKNKGKNFLKYFDLFTGMNDLGKISDNFGIQSNYSYQGNKDSDKIENNYANHIIDFWHTKFIKVRESKSREIDDDLKIYINIDIIKYNLEVQLNGENIKSSDSLSIDNLDLFRNNIDFNIKIGNLFYNNSNLDLQSFKILKIEGKNRITKYEKIYNLLREAEKKIISDVLDISDKNKFRIVKTGLNDLFKYEIDEGKIITDSDIHGFINLKIIDRDGKLKYIVYNESKYNNKIEYLTHEELKNKLKKEKEEKKNEIYYKYQVFNIENSYKEISNTDQIYFILYKKNVNTNLSEPFGLVRIKNGYNISIDKNFFNNEKIYAGKLKVRIFKNRIFKSKSYIFKYYYYFLDINNNFSYNFSYTVKSPTYYPSSISKFENPDTYTYKYFEETLDKNHYLVDGQQFNLVSDVGGVKKFNYKLYSDILNEIETNTKLNLKDEIKDCSYVRIHKLPSEEDSNPKLEYDKKFNLVGKEELCLTEPYIKEYTGINKPINNTFMISLNNIEIEDSSVNKFTLNTNRKDKNLIKNLGDMDIKDGTDLNKVVTHLKNKRTHTENENFYKKMFEVKLFGKNLKKTPNQQISENLLGNIYNTTLNPVSKDEIDKNTVNKIKNQNYIDNYKKTFNIFDLIKYIESEYTPSSRNKIKITRDNTEGIIDISSTQKINYTPGKYLTDLYFEKEKSSNTYSETQ